jgi:hypothetical protein
MKFFLFALSFFVFSSARAEDYSPYKSMQQRTYVIEQIKALPAKLPCDDGDYDGRTRLYHTGDALTMDFEPKRLNVELDKNDKFIKAYCG